MVEPLSRKPEPHPCLAYWYTDSGSPSGASKTMASVSGRRKVLIPCAAAAWASNCITASQCSTYRAASTLPG